MKLNARVSSRALFLELRQGMERLRRHTPCGKAPVLVVSGRIVHEIRCSEADLLFLLRGRRRKRSLKLSFPHGDALKVGLELRRRSRPTLFAENGQ